MQPKTLIEAVKYFSDLDKCNTLLADIKWPDGKIVCPKCGNDSCKPIASRPNTIKCNRKSCQRQFSYKVGTIFEDSPLGLDKWFVAVWCIVNAKNGISSYELHRALGVCQKTAWFMLHRIRLAMQEGSFEKKLSGTIESDETFVGGKAKNMHKDVRARKITGRGANGKAIVHGVLERGGKIIAGVVGNRKRKAVQNAIRENVAPGATVYTDELKSYIGLDDAFTHEMINHAKEYVRGNVHTNGMENFWSLLKRCINGTYISVMPWQLARYVDEQVCRFNARKLNDSERFTEVMHRVVGRRLMFTDLCESL